MVGDDGEWPRVLLRRPDVAFPNPLQWTADGTSVLALLELPSRNQQLVLIAAETGAVTALERSAEVVSTLRFRRMAAWWSSIVRRTTIRAPATSTR